MRYGIAILFGLIVSLGLTPVVRRWAIKRGIVDRPRGLRKLHDQPIPLLGGIALYLTFVLGIVFFSQLGLLNGGKPPVHYWWLVVLGGLFIAYGGYLDDRFDLPPLMQFVFPVAATLILLWGGIKISFVTSPVGGVWQVTTWLGSVLTFLWILGMMYTTKFLDGLDGLVCGVTVIASVVIFIVSLFWDDRSSATGLVALLVAGMALGFLRFNFFPAKIFLGEGGSVFLGYLLGVLSIISGSKIATAMLVMALPIIDTFWVIVRRVIQGRSPVLADRKHFHFRLLDQGWGHVQAVIFIYVLTLIFGVTGLVLSTRGKIIALVMVVALTTFLIRSFYTPARRRFSRPSH